MLSNDEAELRARGVRRLGVDPRPAAQRPAPRRAGRVGPVVGCSRQPPEAARVVEEPGCGVARGGPQRAPMGRTEVDAGVGPDGARRWPAVVSSRPGAAAPWWPTPGVGTASGSERGNAALDWADEHRGASAHPSRREKVSGTFAIGERLLKAGTVIHRRSVVVGMCCTPTALHPTLVTAPSRRLVAIAGHGRDGGPPWTPIGLMRSPAP